MPRAIERTVKILSAPSLEIKPDPKRNIVKLDHEELKNYLAELTKFMKQPGSVALRICECCLNVT